MANAPATVARKGRGNADQRRISQWAPPRRICYTAGYDGDQRESIKSLSLRKGPGVPLGRRSPADPAESDAKIRSFLVLIFGNPIHRELINSATFQAIQMAISTLHTQTWLR